MPRYFFDITDGGPHRDDDMGTECADEEGVREMAMQALPDIASELILDDGDRRFFTVVARDETGHAIYTATLSLAGMWLDRRP